MTSVGTNNLNWILNNHIPQYLQKPELAVFACVARGTYLGGKTPKFVNNGFGEPSIMRLALKELVISTYRTGRARAERTYPTPIETRTNDPTNVEKIAQHIFPLMAGFGAIFAAESIMQNQSEGSHLALSLVLLVSSVASARWMRIPNSNQQPLGSAHQLRGLLIATFELGLNTFLPQATNDLPINSPDINALSKFLLLMPLAGAYNPRNKLPLGIWALGRTISCIASFSPISCVNGALIGQIATPLPWSKGLRRIYIISSRRFKQIYTISNGARTSAAICLPLAAKSGQAQIRKHKLSTAIDTAATSAVLMAVGVGTFPALAGGLAVAGLAKCLGTSALSYTAQTGYKIQGMLGRLVRTIYARSLHIIHLS